MNDNKITSAERVLRVLKAMQNNSYLGMTNKEIADTTNDTAVNVSRALTALISEGLVIKLESDRFGYTPLFAQIATRHMAQIDQNIQRAEEAKQRINTALYQ